MTGARTRPPAVETKDKADDEQIVTAEAVMAKDKADVLSQEGQ